MAKLLFIILLLATGIARAADGWPAPIPPTGFPEFLSSDEGIRFFLNDLFRRHWFTLPGPGAYSGDQQTIWREWNSLNTAWVDTSALKPDYNSELRKSLLETEIDESGYVYTYSPDSGYQNKLGWPFPNFQDSGGLSRGWDFSGDSPDGWTVDAAETKGVGKGAWEVSAESSGALRSPAVEIEAEQSPYIVIAASADAPVQMTLSWTGRSPGSVTFQLQNSPKTLYLPLWKQPGWRGKITSLTLAPSRAATLRIDRIHCAYDTRHPTNNANLILASWRYFLWTGDTEFLRANALRLRRAMRFMTSDLHGEKEGVIVVNWWGHDGTSGLVRDKDGRKTVLPGRGIGNNYWDIMPFGGKDAYATAYFLAALKATQEFEEYASTPKHGVPANPFGQDAAWFGKLAGRVQKTASRMFWNSSTRRFNACIDLSGKAHDYGFVYHNLEALYYGLGDAKKAGDVLGWLDGKRIVSGDTSTGKDIYHWRFAPRATTLRNIDWYIWSWYDPESLPWGGQVQDGGTSFYISFYDILNRIRFRGPDDAYARLKEIMRWYEEVRMAGGYRKYYEDGKIGTLQGGPTAGGLGIDSEFVETDLVPLVALYGFMGVDATPRGLVVRPRLPTGVFDIGVMDLAYQGARFNVVAFHDKVRLRLVQNPLGRRFAVNGQAMPVAFDERIPVSDKNPLLLTLIK